MSTQTCTCGRPFGPGSSGRQNHQLVHNHRPTPAPPPKPEPEPDELDRTTREHEAEIRAARRGGGS